MELVAVVTGCPRLSSTLTAGWLPEVQAAPLAPPPGWVLKASWVAEPTVMVNGVLVAPLSPLEVALSV